MGNLFSNSPKTGYIYTGPKPASTSYSTTLSTRNDTYYRYEDDEYEYQTNSPLNGAITPVNCANTPASRTFTPVNRTSTPSSRTFTPVNRTSTPSSRTFNRTVTSVNRVTVPAITNKTPFQNGRQGNQVTTPRQNNRNSSFQNGRQGNQITTPRQNSNRNSSFQNRRSGNRAVVRRDYSTPDDDFEDQKEYRIKRNYLFLYHYTNFESALGILESGVLKASQSGAYGSGVYLTDLRPWHGKERLLSNNWCEGPDSSYRSRATVCFEFISDQINAQRKCQDRKIWTVPNDISLPTYRPKLFLVFDDKDGTGKREKIKKINELKKNPDTYNKIRQIKVTFL